MKTTKFLALATLLISIGAFLAAQAHEHPKTPEHPANAEHPAKAEHPGQKGDIISVASSSDNFTTFIAAMEAAGLTDKLQADGPFTVFAPTDEAFAKLGPGVVEDLLKPANHAKLAGLLANHVVPGKLLSADIKTMKASNFSGQDLDIQVLDGVVTVNKARVVEADLKATNGVIHGIDAVLVSAPGTEHPEHPEHPAADAPKDHPAH